MLRNKQTPEEGEEEGGRREVGEEEWEKGWGKRGKWSK